MMSRLRSFAKAAGLTVAAHRRVVVQDALDDAGLEDADLAQQREPRDLAVELVEVLRPPGDLKLVRLRGHASLLAGSAGDR